jgi:hypothetical protein
MSGNPTYQELAHRCQGLDIGGERCKFSPTLPRDLPHFSAAHHLPKVAKTDRCLYTAAS